MSRPDNPAEQKADVAEATGAARARPSDLTAAYTELQSLLVDLPGVMEFLDQVAVLASSVVPGSSCGITMQREGQTATVASSSELAAQVDEIQYGQGQGPCLESLRSGQAVIVTDLASDDRWGDYRTHALAYGVRSSLSLPMAVDGQIRGALNLYSASIDDFDEARTSRAAAFTRQAASALTVVLRNTDRTVLEGQLRDALATRAVIDQATGIIMGQQRITSSAAFAVLRQASQSRNRKLHQVAADLVRSVTGEAPTPPPPFAPPR